MSEADVTCPRCGVVVAYSGRGRRPVWCSQRCRQEAYETRRAAREQGRAVEVVVRERVVQAPAEVQSMDDHVLALVHDPQAVLSLLRIVHAMDSDGFLHGRDWARVRYFMRSYSTRDE